MAELFDDLSRIFASPMPRRTALRLIFGSITVTWFDLRWPAASYADVKVICTQTRDPRTGQLIACRIVDEDCGDTCCCPGQTCCAHNGKGTECCTGKTTPCRGPNNKCSCCTADHCCNGECCDACHACENGQCVPRNVCPPDTKCCPKPNGDVVCCTQGQCCFDGRCVSKTGTRDSRISVFRANGTQQVQVTVADPNGIGTITVRESINAMVDIPSFVPGVTAVVITATKINPGARSSVQLEVCPPATCACTGCCGIVDPSLAQLDIPEGTHETRERFTGIPASEHFVTVQNCDSGLRRVQIVVNGRMFPPRWMRDNDVRTIDIGPAMKAAENVVTVVANGRPGSSALVLVSDLPAWPKSLSRPPLIEWEPGQADSGVNLHWGN